MNEYLLATHALPEHTVAALRTMLKSIEPMVGSRWQLRDAMPADVLIAPLETLARLPQVARPGKLPIFIALGESGAALPIACATLPRPVTVPDLVEGLRKAMRLIDEIRAPQSDELSTVPLLEQFGGAQKFTAHAVDTRLRTTLRAAIFRLFQTPAAATLIDEQRQAVFSMLPGVGYTTRLNTAGLSGLLRTNPPAILIELSDVEQRILSQARNFYPMADLEWMFWITSRSPFLRTELNRHATYRLTRWPDFARLAHSNAEVQLASFLMAQPMTAALLQERSGATEERTLNFLNAAYALGLLAQAAAPPAARGATASEHKAPSGLASLIAQVRRKFGFNASEGD